MNRTFARLLAAAIAVIALATTPVTSSATGRILPVEANRGRAVEVPAWNPASPQKLVRIDGSLFQEDAGRYFGVIPGRVTVRLAEGVESWDEVVDRAIAASPSEFETLTQLRPLRKNRLGVLRLEIPEGADQPALCELIERTGLVRYAEVGTYSTFHAVPNDPRYMDQWSMKNTGQNNGTPGADVDAELAWDITAGDPSIIVAVLDSGTDIDHEDLAPSVWHNTGEIPGNAIDDDMNGYVDDWEGWDFHNMNNDPRPSFYHGTHVTGIINAVGDNGIGIAGLAGGLGGNPGVLGMALGVGDDFENEDVIDEAVLYAADEGAHVITFALTTSETQAINDALDYAYHTKDVFIDCSAGNDASVVTFPARHPLVMAVASTDNDDEKSGFSNFGLEIEIAAPGENILSTQLNDSYSTSSGTSFSSPHVAAVAGLVRGLNPNLTAGDVRTVITESADDVEEPGFDIKTGHGRLNAHQAVLLASTPSGVVRFSADEFPCGGMLDLVLFDSDLAGAGSASVAVSSDTEPGGETVAMVESNPGSGLFRGSIPSAAQAALPDGTLQVADGDALLVEYVDLDDGAGGTNVTRSHNAVMDCVVPTISNVAVQSVTGDAATISWNTDQPSTSIVTYDPVVPPATLQVDGVNKVSHSIDLDGLAPCTVYYFSVASTDPAGNQGVADDGGAFFHFETLGDFGQGLQACHQGRVTFDAATVGCASSMPVTVGDQDLNLDIAALDTVVVALTSTTESTPETLLLTETAPNSSIFSGSVPTAPGAAAPSDGTLQVADGDLLTVTYQDDDDGTGKASTTFDTAAADCTGPLGVQVLVRDITDTNATVEWTALEPTTGHVEWGTTTALGNVATAGALAATQAVSIGTFPECGRVYFRVHSTDAAGNASVTDAGGQPFEFDAFTLNGVVHADGFESDLGWTLEGEWEIGAPQGLGTAPGDPVAASGGSQVLGHDLSGQGTAPGDYETLRTRSAISPVLDLSALSVVELRFDRWLNVENTATSSVDVRDSGGVWQTVWSSTTTGDTAWSEQVFDVTAHAADNAAFQVRFLQNSRFRTAAGWNVDRLFLRDASIPTWGGCSACGGGPTFAGAIAATDDDPCADSGVTVNWSEAPAWGTGFDGTYAIYRGTSPGFTPAPGNLVASGVAGSSWTDPSPPAGVPLYYVVRAENDESCGTGPANGGLVDGNSIEVSTTNEISQPVPGDVGNTLLVRTVNGAHVRLDWAAALNAAGYRVYRSSSPDSFSTSIGSPASIVFEESGGLGGSGVAFYNVVAADACGNESAD